MNGNKIQVFIFSQQSLLRQGIEHSLSLMDDIEISAAPEVNDEVRSAMDDLPPDVAVVDIDDLAGGGLAITRQLKQRLPNMGIIALTSNYNDVQLFEALKSQAAACLSNEITSE